MARQIEARTDQWTVRLDARSGYIFRGYSDYSSSANPEWRLRDESRDRFEYMDEPSPDVYTPSLVNSRVHRWYTRPLHALHRNSFPHLTFHISGCHVSIGFTS